MNAFEFVKNHSLMVGRVILGEIPLCAHSFVMKDSHTAIYLQKVEDRFYWYNDTRSQYDYYGLVEKSEACCLTDLKRVVESHEIVKDYYGLLRAKEHAESKYTAPEIVERLKQAVRDVEACQ